MSNPESQYFKTRMAEAARYALMRRLVPALRHNMAGSLQPISMISAMLERRLHLPEPDMAQLGKNSRDIGALSREATATCMSLMTWLIPKDAGLVPINAGVDESIALIATELSFRGISVSSEIGHLDTLVPRCLLRSVFMASLIALTDAAQSTAKVVVAVRASAEDLLLSITLVPTDGETSPNPGPPYRSIDWADLQALADEDRVELTVAGNLVEIRHQFDGIAAGRPVAK